MTRPVLVLRPQPGADATAGRARSMGLEAIIAPLFRIVARDWAMPGSFVEALLVTSANAARALGPEVPRSVPVYVVGEATAQALRNVGFSHITAGLSDVADIVRRAERDGVASLLHLCGEDRTRFDPGTVNVEQRTVYAAQPIEPGRAFAEALDRGAVALLHSARAARRFREIAGTGHRIATISAAVLDAAGTGWEAAEAADRPQDDALLAAAARLCH
jgi:uroporphyrinogen-III synthase